DRADVRAAPGESADRELRDRTRGGRVRRTQPRIGVLVFPGSQDDRAAAWALGALDAEPVMIWHGEEKLPSLDAVVLPGGFSYGDYLRCGAIARFSPAMQAVSAVADAGGVWPGRCNR